jgi:hypothetical protein
MPGPGPHVGAGRRKRADALSSAGADLVIFIGDSNCRGTQNNPEALSYAADPLTQAWNGNAWAPYVPNTNVAYTPAAGLTGLEWGGASGFWGPEARFIQQYRAANPARRLFVLKYAVSGSMAMYDAVAAGANPLKGWDAASGGTAMNLAKIELDQAVMAMTALGYAPTLKLVSINLGANDAAFPVVAAGFQNALGNMISTLRASWGFLDGTTRIVLNRVQLNGVDSAGRGTVRAATEALAHAAYDVFWVDIDASTNNGTGDVIHFNAAGQIANGNLIWGEYASPENTLIMKLGADAVAWWDAGAGVSLAASNVTAWRDRIGGVSPAQVTAANQPTWAASDYNSGPSVTFDGVNDQLTASTGVSGLPAAATPSWLWAVVQQDATFAQDGGATRGMCMWGNTSGSAAQRRHSRTTTAGEDRLGVSVGNGSASIPVVTSGVFIGKHTALLKVEASQASARLDQGPTGTGSVVPATGVVNVLSIGSAFSFAYWQGKMRDILITRPLSAEKEAAVRALLSAR